MLRQRLPLWLGALAGAYVVAGRFVPRGADPGFAETGDRWIIASAAAAVLVGVINLTRIHLDRVLRRRAGWHESAVLLGAMYGYALVVLATSPAAPAADWVFRNVMAPLYATMFSLIAFFVTTAAYRAFRARTLEGAVLLIAAVVALIGLSPLGDTLLHGWGGLAEWLLAVPVAGAYRAIQVGAALGALATAVRILLGLERAHLGGGGG